MIEILLDGQEHTAGRLAAAADVAASTASEHLAVLVSSGLVARTAVGRCRHYKIADASIAESLEALSRPGTPMPVTSLRLSREQVRIRTARTCYDHLAGRLGVAVHEAFTTNGWVEAEQPSLTRSGSVALRALGVDVDGLARARRPLFRVCRDWTEGRDHFGGSLAAAVCSVSLAQGWVARVPNGRGLRITPTGREAFLEDLHLAPADWL
jgi:DNA-binding transcriptional ArsR family regulator